MRDEVNYCALVLPLSPSCDVLEEEDEGDADADEADRHGGDDELLQTVEHLLLGVPPRRQQAAIRPLVVQVLERQYVDPGPWADWEFLPKWLFYSMHILATLHKVILDWIFFAQHCLR